MKNMGKKKQKAYLLEEDKKSLEDYFGPEKNID